MMTFDDMVERFGELGAIQVLETLESSVHMDGISLEPEKRLELVLTAMAQS
jgi:hypothetical protein